MLETLLTGVELPFPNTSRGCSHCFIFLLFLLLFFLSIFLKLIANYRLCVVRFAFTASLVERDVE